MTQKAFLNGELIDIDKACIPASDSGFLYGAGLFETMRACGGRIFSLEDHLDRLFFSIKTLAFNNTYDRSVIREAISQVLRVNELSDARVRLTLTGGPMAEDDEHRRSTLLITAAAWTPYPPAYYRKGVTVILCPYKQNPDDPTTGHKVTSYFSRMTALRLAHTRGAAEALWFTVDHRLAEGCVSNVFLVKDSVLYTPGVNTPVLAGVARKAVCQIAIGESVKLVEKDLTINDVLDADEIFLTNVVMQVMPVVAVEKHTVGDGTVGDWSKKLYEHFQNHVRTICGKE